MNQTTPQSTPTVAKNTDEASFIDPLIVLAKYKKMILGIIVGVAMITAVISLSMPNIYTATARILPPQQQQSTATTMLGQLGGLTGMVGSTLGIKNPNDLYVGMLSSRVIADDIIARFRLKELYKKSTLEGTRATLRANVNFSSGKDGIISISVDDQEPKRAAAIANTYIDELDKLTQNLAVTEASQRRLFFERQLMRAKDDLANAEIALKTTQQKSGLIQPDEQGKSILGAVSKLRGKITDMEVQLGTMRSFATEDNPEYVRKKTELAGLRAQLSTLEKAQGLNGTDVMASTGNMPEASLEYVRKFRDVKYNETIYELIARQFEAAKLDEAKSALVIQVLDKAVVPENKSKPSRADMVILSALIAGFLSTLLAFILNGIEKNKGDPVSAERMELLLHALKNWSLRSS